MCTTIYPQSEEDSHALLQNRTLNTENERLKRDVHLLKEMVKTVQEELIREQAHHKITQANLHKITNQHEKQADTIKQVQSLSGDRSLAAPEINQEPGSKI